MAISPATQKQINTWALNFLSLSSQSVLAAWYITKRVPGYQVLVRNANPEIILWYNTLIKPYVKLTSADRPTIKFDVRTYPSQLASLRGQAISLATLAGASPIGIIIGMKTWDAWYAKYITRYNR